MILRRVVRVGMLCVLLAGLLHGAVASAQEAFTSASFDVAKDAALADGKYLLVNASADWCSPCRRMDATTWVDEAVRGWIAENAIAVKIDTDEHKDLAVQLGVSALPTVIVFRDDSEFDRVVGYRDPEALLSWLDGVRRGEREIDRLRAAAGDRMDAEGNVDVRARLNFARELARSPTGFEEATEEFVWLWDNMLDYAPSMVGVRLSFMVADMGGLASRYEPAREAFTALRDRYDPIAGSDRGILIDWIKLNEVIGDEDATLAWFDRFKEREEGPEMFALVDRELYRLLSSRERWAEIALIYPSQGRLISVLERDQNSMERQVEMLASRPAPSLPDDMPEEEKARLAQMRAEAPLRSFRDKTSHIYAALLAAGREEDAEEVAMLLLGGQDTAVARTALVEVALEAGEPRPHHLRWLEEAEESGGEEILELRGRLESALRERQPPE